VCKKTYYNQNVLLVLATSKTHPFFSRINPLKFTPLSRGEALKLKRENKLPSFWEGLGMGF